MDTRQTLAGPSGLRPATDAAILGLPGVEIHERGKGLAENGKRHPKDGIAQDLAAIAPHLFQGRGNGDEGELQKHASKGDA